jgi:hypothetical protein
VPHAAGMPSPNPRLNALAFMVAAIVTQGAPYLSMLSSEPPHQLPRCHTKCTSRDSPLQFKIPPPRAIEMVRGNHGRFTSYTIMSQLRMTSVQIEYGLCPDQKRAC